MRSIWQSLQVVSLLALTGACSHTAPGPETAARERQESSHEVAQPPQPSIHRDKEIWDVYEVLFHHQFVHNASVAQRTAKAYCLLIDGADPPAGFLRRFAAHAPPIKAGSAWQGTDLKFHIDKAQWVDDNAVEARGGFSERLPSGGANASGNSYRVERKNGKWIVVKDRLDAMT